MKKIIVISLLAAFLYNLVGFVAAFRVIRSEWRHAIWSELAAHQDDYFLTTFHFAAKQFDTLTHEFQIEGQFYDVVSIEKLGDDSLKVVCFNDAKETELVAHFDQILLDNAAKKSNQSENTNFLFDHLIKEFLFDKPLWLKKTPSVSESFLADFCFKNTFPVAPFIEFIVPPPQACA